MNNILPALSNQCDTGIKHNNNLLPSFIIVKNTRNDHINILKYKEKTKKEVNDKCQQLTIKMREAEWLKGAGLDSARLNILLPPKTSTHSANLAITKNVSAITALRSTSWSKDENKLENNYFTPIQD